MLDPKRSAFKPQVALAISLGTGVSLLAALRTSAAPPSPTSAAELPLRPRVSQARGWRPYRVPRGRRDGPSRTSRTRAATTIKKTGGHAGAGAMSSTVSPIDAIMWSPVGEQHTRQVTKFDRLRRRF